MFAVWVNGFAVTLGTEAECNHRAEYLSRLGFHSYVAAICC